MTGSTRGTALATLLPGFEGPILPDWLHERLRDGLAGDDLEHGTLEVGDLCGDLLEGGARPGAPRDHLRQVRPDAFEAGRGGVVEALVAGDLGQNLHEPVRPAQRLPLRSVTR